MPPFLTGSFRFAAENGVAAPWSISIKVLPHTWPRQICSRTPSSSRTMRGPRWVRSLFCAQSSWNAASSAFMYTHCRRSTSYTREYLNASMARNAPVQYSGVQHAFQRSMAWSCASVRARVSTPALVPWFLITFSAVLKPIPFILGRKSHPDNTHSDRSSSTVHPSKSPGSRSSLARVSSWTVPAGHSLNRIGRSHP